jgi:hypothetical protein
MILTKTLLVVGLYELQILRQAHWSTETRRPGHRFSMEVSKRMISVDIMPYGQTISLDLYIQTIKTLQTCSRRVRFDTNIAAVLQHDNARSNTNIKTQETITPIGWLIIPHQLYRPDLASSDL